MRKGFIAVGMWLSVMALPFVARAAEIYLDPAAGKYAPGVTFGVDVRLNNQSQCINAAEVDIAYPQKLLTAVAATDGNSIFSLWVKPPTIYSDYGLISFIGGLPGGYCGRVSGDSSLSNKLATIYFQFPTSTAISSSTLSQFVAKLSFLSSTRAVLNDGLGTFATLTTAGGSYGEIVNGQYAPVSVWQNALTNDTTPPEPFTIGIYRDPSLFSGQWFAVFSTVDKQTGIDHYDVAEVRASDLTVPQSQWNWARAVSPYLIKDQSLNSTIAVRAVDAAGNVRVEQYTSMPTPQGSPWEVAVLPYVAIIGVVGLAIIRIILQLL